MKNIIIFSADTNGFVNDRVKLGPAKFNWLGLFGLSGNVMDGMDRHSDR